MARHFLPQFLSRSRASPLSFILHCHHDPSLAREIEQSQNRWRSARLVAAPLRLDCAQLVQAPLTDLHLLDLGPLLVGFDDTIVLWKLTRLSLTGCDASLLWLAVLSPNLEYLLVALVLPRTVEKAMQAFPLIRLTYLRRLSLQSCDYFFEKLSCPMLTHLQLFNTSLEDIHLFVERSGSSILHLDIGHEQTRAILPWFPSIHSLSIDDSDNDILESLLVRHPESGEFELCPALEVVRLDCYGQIWSDLDIIRFIETRWHATDRRIRNISLVYHRNFRFCSADDPSTLPKTWKGVARCITEGLLFSAS